MAVAVNPSETPVTKVSLGMLQTQTDVCKTPSPSGPVPMPYPNIAMSAQLANATSTVSVEGSPVCVKGSNIALSSGDEPGSLGGVVSSCIKGKAEPIAYSFDVKFEGKNVVRRSDPFTQNKGNCF